MGTPLILTCSLTYEYQFCRHVEVGWHQNSSGLADPSRYLTTVNETILDNENRLRQVTTKILSLIHEDNGYYQCLAECESKEQSRGHFVEVIVKGIGDYLGVKTIRSNDVRSLNPCIYPVSNCFCKTENIFVSFPFRIANQE